MWAQDNRDNIVRRSAAEHNTADLFLLVVNELFVARLVTWTEKTEVKISNNNVTTSFLHQGRADLQVTLDAYQHSQISPL